MRYYKDYITNLKEYEHMNLYDTAAILSIRIHDYTYVTYGKSMIPTMVSTISKLNNGKLINQKLLDMYQKYGDSELSVTILEIGDYNELQKKAKRYIKELKPELNYQHNGVKDSGKLFSEQHCENLSKSKIGERHNRAKLTEEQAIEIKKLALYTNMSSREIAEMFHISPGQVRKIKSGTAWGHIQIFVRGNLV
ncbi:hypothetical protein ACTFQN_26035 [Bacillus cereus group sp. MYBK30-1]|uniref:hypothetical protein n=1 Tax=unclassified Bacillus cereus group TaxID=2750818 RepID=UPI003F7A0FB8